MNKQLKDQKAATFCSVYFVHVFLFWYSMKYGSISSTTIVLLKTFKMHKKFKISHNLRWDGDSDSVSAGVVLKLFLFLFF